MISQIATCRPVQLPTCRLADFYGLVPIWYRQDGLFCEEVQRRLAIRYRIPFVWNQVPHCFWRKSNAKRSLRLLFDTVWYRQDGLFCEEVLRGLAIWYRLPFVWNQVPNHFSEEVPHETLVFLIVWYRRLLFGTVWYRQDGLFCEEVLGGFAIWYRHPI